MDLTDRIFHFLSRYHKGVSSHTFGLFRILFSLHVLLIVSEVFRYRELIFDTIPAVSKNVFPVMLFLFVWSLSVCALLIGLYTRVAAFINYIFIVIATSIFTNSNVGTFNDDLLRMGSFLCIFMPVSRSFSLDSIRTRLTLFLPEQPKTNYLNYILFIFLSLGLLYFPSGLTKTYSPMWMSGLGLWIPFNIPHNKWNILPNLIVNQYWFMVSMNYLVIVWEIAFIFILFIPKWHRYIVIPGLLFHLGIASLFPFPVVCTGPLVFYALFIPDSFWIRLSKRIRAKRHHVVYFNSVNSLELRLTRILSAFDFRSKYRFVNTQGHPLTWTKTLDLLGRYPIYQPFADLLARPFYTRILRTIYSNWTNNLSATSARPLMNGNFRYSAFIWFCMMCALMQGAISAYHVYNHFHAGAEKRMEYMRKRKEGYDLSMKPTNLVRTFLGINSRGLFLDHANTGQKTTYGITLVDTTGKETWLPMINERGYVDRELNMNMAWAKVTFNLLGFSTSPADSIGLKKLTKFWAMQHHIQTDHLHLKVYGKTYTYPTEFETNYYLKLEHLPWKPEGEMWWRNGVFSYIRLATDTIR